MIRLCFLVFAFLLAEDIEAQTLSPTVLNSSGGNMQNGSNSLEWSLGELAVSTLASPSILLTQGFLQPIVNTVGTEGLFDGNRLAIFPNPVSDWLNIQGDTHEIKTIKVFDALGKMTIESEFQQILDVHLLGSGFYVVCLYNPKNQHYHSFKIYKI